MKKIKKILLAFAPLTAIAIATPIVLTACSDTTTNTTTPDDNNSGSGGNGGGGENSKPINPSFSKDNTNSDKYQLEANSKAQEILNKYKAAKGQAAAEKVLTDELANFPKKDSGTLAKDVLNMWSNNNWFTITQTAKDAKVKETFISSLTINKAEVDATSKASFDVEYKSAFKDSTGKLYEATQVLKADKVQVDATTKIEIPKQIPEDGYKIDGEIQKLTSTSLFVAEVSSDPKTNLENNLKQNKVSLDAKQVFQTFITNHNIAHGEEPANATAPIWNKTEIDKDTSLTYSSGSAIVMQLSSTGDSNWGNCVDTTPYANIVSTMKNTTYNNKIKSLITTNDYDISTFEYGLESDNGNGTKKMTITINFTKKSSAQGNDTKPTLTFEIKGFGKIKA